MDMIQRQNTWESFDNLFHFKHRLMGIGIHKVFQTFFYFLPVRLISLPGGLAVSLTGSDFFITFSSWWIINLETQLEF